MQHGGGALKILFYLTVVSRITMSSQTEKKGEGQQVTPSTAGQGQQVSEQGGGGAATVPITMRDFFFRDPFYRTGWDDYDLVRSTMMKEPVDLMRRMEDDFRTRMRCMRDNIMLGGSSPLLEEEPEEESLLSPFSGGLTTSLFPRRYLLPALVGAPELSAAMLFQEADSDVIRIKEDDNKLELSLDTSQYRPDELHVRYNDGVLSIDGKHEERSEDGTSVTRRQFTKRYTVPSDPEHITSNLSSDGVLVVKAEKNKPRGEIPIKQA